jgi:hypothetical protein
MSENLVAPGIEPGPLDLLAGTLATRPQRRSVACGIFLTFKNEFFFYNCENNSARRIILDI